jgi:hypothetical protein
MTTDSAANQLPQWTGGSGIPVTVDAAGSISAHAQSLSVLFDTFALAPPSGAGQSTVHTVAFRTVLRTAEPVQLGITHFIRGRIVKGAESRVVLMAILGPSVVVREYAYGAPVNDDILIEHQYSFTHAGRQPYTGIITVLIEQREGDAAILVTIDSVDATVALPQGEEGTGA